MKKLLVLLAIVFTLAAAPTQAQSSWSPHPWTLHRGEATTFLRQAVKSDFWTTYLGNRGHGFRCPRRVNRHRLRCKMWWNGWNGVDLQRVTGWAVVRLWWVYGWEREWTARGRARLVDYDCINRIGKSRRACTQARGFKVAGHRDSTGFSWVG